MSYGLASSSSRTWGSSTPTCSATRVEAIAREKLAVAQEDSIVFLPDETFAQLVPAGEIRFGGAREAAEAFVGHAIAANPEVTLPGRLERRGENEIRDGAHNPDGVRYLAERVPPGDYTLVVSILADKNADEMLRELRRVGIALGRDEVVVSSRAAGRARSPSSAELISVRSKRWTTPGRHWPVPTSSGDRCS